MAQPPAKVYRLCIEGATCAILKFTLMVGRVRFLMFKRMQFKTNNSGACINVDIAIYWRIGSIFGFLFYVLENGMCYLIMGLQISCRKNQQLPFVLKISYVLLVIFSYRKHLLHDGHHGGALCDRVPPLLQGGPQLARQGHGLSNRSLCHPLQHPKVFRAADQGARGPLLWQSRGRN